MIALRWYTVITADVVASRGWPGLSQNLREHLAELSDPELLTPFTVSRGDEIQAVCRGALLRPQLLRLLRYRCRPLQLRIGVGLGDVEDASPAESSWEMNGSAFHRSRSALQQAEKGRAGCTRFASGVALYNEIADATYALIDAVMSRWTDPQWEAIHVYERTGTYEAAAAEIGVAFQNVAKRCKAARWQAVRQAEGALPSLQAVLP